VVSDVITTLTGITEGETRRATVKTERIRKKRDKIKVLHDHMYLKMMEDGARDTQERLESV
jgi:hypothetical protein